MATQGKRLDPSIIARIRRLTAVCRLSVRKAAREAGVDAKTVQKYAKAVTTSVSGQPASASGQPASA